MIATSADSILSLGTAELARRALASLALSSDDPIEVTLAI